MTTLVKGKCACAAIKYTITETVKSFHPCHCSTCRAWSGGVNMSIEAGTNPEIDDPEDNLKIWKSSAWAERGFCKTCGSSLFYRLTAPGPLQNKHYFCAGGLEKWDEAWKLDNELYIDCKPKNYCLEGDHTKLTKAQVEAMFADVPETPAEEDTSTKLVSEEEPDKKRVKTS